MSTFDSKNNSAIQAPRLRSRIAAVASGIALAAATLVATPSAANAAPVAIDNATFEWTVSDGMQTSLAGRPTQCNYFSAGTSDGTEDTYLTDKDNVSIVKNGVAPTWAGRCDGAGSGAVNQKIVWSGGTGSVDLETGIATIAFTGEASINGNFGLSPFTINNPVITVAADGTGTVTAKMTGYRSAQGSSEKTWIEEPYENIVVADLAHVVLGAHSFSALPLYEGVEVNVNGGVQPPAAAREGNGVWGSWPESFVDFHYNGTGLTSYWHTSGTNAATAGNLAKRPHPIVVNYWTQTTETATQSVGFEVTELEEGELAWSIDGDGQVNLGVTTNAGAYLEATGAINPIVLRDSRVDGPEWSISGQVGNFTNNLDGKYLGWTPKILEAGAGAKAGGPVASGIGGGMGLSSPSLLASATAGHDGGTATLGADLVLRVPSNTEAGIYSATLTITALS